MIFEWTLVLLVIYFGWKYFELWKLKKHDDKVNFKNKVVLITGASSGIGKQMALDFNRLGAEKVIICARRTEELQKVKDSSQFPEKIDIVKMDLADITSLKTQAQNLAREYKIDILVNNGGTSMRDEFKNIELDMVTTMMNANYLSGVCLARYIGESMVQRKSGHIVNINSISGLFPTPVRTIYCASKFAMNIFSSSIRGELKNDNIHVTDIYPGYVQTNISKNALTGDGNSFGKVDENIGKGLKVEDAVRIMLNGVFYKHNRIMVCGMAYVLAVFFGNASEELMLLFSRFKYKSQLKAMAKAT